MFHVEPVQKFAGIGQAGRRLRRRDQHLCRCSGQTLQDAGLMVPIKLRAEVIQRNHGPLSAFVGEILCLGKQARQRGQLRLTSR